MHAYHDAVKQLQAMHMPPLHMCSTTCQHGHPHCAGLPSSDRTWQLACAWIAQYHTLQAACWTIRQLVACRVDLHAQRGVSEADNKLTTAVKTVFASSAPSFWFLLAMLVPAPLQPLIKTLSARFPDEKLSALHKAYEVVYDVSATLIEVSLDANMAPLNSTTVSFRWTAYA